jgi:hypothetical protein
MAHSIDLIAVKPGKPKLMINGFALHLDEADLQRLADVGCQAADCCGGEREIAPYMVHVQLPYSDLSDDQSTPAFNLYLRCDDPALAREIRDALTRELAATVAFFHETATIPVAPFLRIRASEVEEPFTTVADAVARLRGALLAHQSDSVLCLREHKYWNHVGFSPDEWKVFRYHVIDDFPRHECDPDGSDAADAIDAYQVDFEEDAEGERTDVAQSLYAKFKRWAAGEPIPLAEQPDNPSKQCHTF